MNRRGLRRHSGWTKSWNTNFTGASACPLLRASKGNVGNYTADLNDVETTVDRLRQFLDEVRSRTKADRIHIIVHSTVTGRC